MRPSGLAEVEAARADGRWDAAYEGQRRAKVPDDLQRELDRNAPAREFFATLDSANRYAILYRLDEAKKPETRERRLRKFVTMLERGETDPLTEGAPMAQEMTIRGTQDQVKVRSPWAVALLPIVTLGIYHLVWWYRINRELRDYGYAKEQNLGQNPTNSVLALFPGGLIIVPALITYWRGFKRVQAASGLAGRERANGWIALILYLLLAPALWAYIQVSLNEIWEQDADALPEGEPPGQPQADADPDGRLGRLAADAAAPLPEAVGPLVEQLARGLDGGAEGGEGEGAADRDPADAGRGQLRAPRGRRAGRAR